MWYQGLWNKYVEMRNMTMKAGEADVGMKRSGNQLRRQNMVKNWLVIRPDAGRSKVVGEESRTPSAGGHLTV